MLKQAIRINPNHPTYYHELGKIYLKLGNELNEKQDLPRTSFYKLAIENFQKSITINPVDSVTQLHLTFANFHISKSLDELIDATKRIQKIDPYNKVLTKLL